jgi:hypothetical protein
MEEDTAAIIEAVIDSYKNQVTEAQAMATDSDQKRTVNGIDPDETDLIEQVFSISLLTKFQLSDYHPKVLGTIFGEVVHFHLLEADNDYFELLGLESRSQQPIRPDHQEFQALNTKWISETGIHFGWDVEAGEIILAARIT